MGTKKIIIGIMCMFAGIVTTHAQDNEQWARLNVYTNKNATLKQEATTAVRE